MPLFSFHSLEKRIGAGVSALIGLFRVPTDNPELLRAQFLALSKQAPLLYFLLISNSAAVAFTFSRRAPAWLSIDVPAVLCALCATRLYIWWRQGKKAPVLSDEALHSHLRLTNILACFIGAVFTAWGLMLFHYGDTSAKAHVAFYMAITVIGCIFCLMHLRSAALTITLLVNIPCAIYFFMQPDPTLKAITVNLILVCATMIVILFIYSRDFARMVTAQQDLRRQQEALTVQQSETQALSDENFRLANLDSLTGLTNRRHFFASIETLFAEASNDAQGGVKTFAIGIVDLDGFKPVNDTYGHQTGDRVLVEVGRRLTEVCGADVKLSRLGGDEFGVIVTRHCGEAELRALGAAISRSIALPFSIGASHAMIGASIGIALYPQSADTAEALFERADYGLYHAKRHQRGQTVIFSCEHEEEIRSHSVIDQALQNADLDAELSLQFQPIVHVADGSLVAFEALARWQSPTLGAVSPAVFIPVAERSGLIGNLTKILLRKALATAAQWPSHVRISFNLSAHDLATPENVLQLIALIHHSGVAPRRIDIEITETATSYDFGQAHKAVSTLKALGVGISLDDFGTGYSSLSHVHRLPLDKIKIDRSFVTDIETDASSRKIVRSLLTLSKDLKITCIVEGVETDAQLKVLTKLGCTYVQGYYFARPMSAGAVQAYLEIAGCGRDALPLTGSL
jgi:diguanylate cyclase (GGDEF)-like protein